MKKLKKGDQVILGAGKKKNGIFDHAFRDCFGDLMFRIYAGNCKTQQTFHPALVRKTEVMQEGSKS